jgi:multidrug resistance efflux pump
LFSLEQNIAQKEQQVNDLLQKLQESQQQVRRSEKQRTDQVKNYFALQGLLCWKCLSCNTSLDLEQVEQLQKENSTLQENFTTCQHSLQYLKQVEKQNRDYFTQSLQQKCACIDRCLTESTQILVNQHTFEHSLLSGWEESLQDTLSVPDIFPFRKKR